MGFNILELMQKFSQFQSLLNQSKSNPADLLNAELKRRNINPQQLQDLITQAKQLEKFIGGKK